MGAGALAGRIARRVGRALWPPPAPPPPPVAAPPQERWTYDRDGLKTLHNSDFLEDTLFREAYRLGRETGSWHGHDIEWRAYIVCWAASKGKGLEGDYVECGVNRGGYSRLAMHYIDFAGMNGKKFYLVDTYNGIPEEFIEEENRALFEGRYAECYEEVVRRFAPFENAVVVRGTVPRVLPEVKAEKVCYLSLDMNCAAPEIAAAEFFWDKLSGGAVMILDDYGFSQFTRQKHAFDAFARAKGVEVLSLPTGQGLIFKP
ncbi:MAG: TylF/MycF/NovP-related O-methyltransferase [Pyrinomonadaceae bacterium]